MYILNLLNKISNNVKIYVSLKTKRSVRSWVGKIKLCGDDGMMELNNWIIKLLIRWGSSC